MNKLLICKNTRKFTADTLYKVLKEVLGKKEPITEAKFRDKWLVELRKNKNVFFDGWYDPPPHGIGVLFAKDSDFSRTNFESLRPENFWPKENVYLDVNNGFLMLYACPVNRATGIIGDFETTVYFGKNTLIQDHLKTNLQIIKRIFNFAQIGMELSDLVKKGQEFFKEAGLINDILSINDATNTNIGHTIPFSYEEMQEKEKEILKNSDKDWSKTLTMISKKRKFVNSQEKLKIKPGMAFTIEPRLKNPKSKNIPLSSFHTIALFHENGEKELLTNFDEIFKLTGMDYLITPTP